MKKKLLCVGVLSLSLFACASNQGASSSNQPVAQTNPSDASNLNGSAADTTTITNNDGMNNQQATNSVYFAVDHYTVDNQYDALINQNATYLAGHTAAHVKVAGNTDDTGSVEYNLALGQRRADATKMALVAKGANIKQIEAISNGKLMAKFSNASDDERSKNRRADIIYTSGQKPAGYHLDAMGLPVLQ